LRTSNNFFKKDTKWTSQNFKKEKALKTFSKSSFMQNFSSSTDFWLFFKKLSGFFRKTLKRIQKNPYMFMQNFRSLACTQTDLDTILTIFEDNFRIFQENSLANSKKFQTWVSYFILNPAKHVHAKLQLSTFYSDRLGQIFDHFWRKF
jgi:hypothetical protein